MMGSAVVALHRFSPRSSSPFRSRRRGAVRSRRGAVALAVALALLALGVARAAGPQIRVLLSDDAPRVEVAFGGAHRAYQGGAPLFRTPFALRWPVVARDGALWIEGRDVGDALLLRADDAAATVEIDGARYRGAVRLLAEGDRLRVVNVLDLESYLRGVVPAEMQAVWPLAALRAQAVAARTYTLAALDPGSDWDVCATDECQVYRGVAAEHPRADRAVADTAGLVLTYGGAFAQTYYHADSGGVIASSAEVWGRSLPYLVTRSDVDAPSPHRSWSVDLDPAIAGREFAARQGDVGDLVSLRPLAYSASGRVVEMEIVGDRGRSVLRGAELRSQLRAWGLKSTRFRVLSGSPGLLRIRGEGWGHGVGMSQYGARTLAALGWDYARILAFYYPATRLQRLAD